MTPEPPDDDKCQISMCRQTHFTYCPHCKLFVCIEHLNEHYATYRQEYQSLIHEGKQQHSCNRELLNQIENEKRYFHQFFHREIQYYEAHEKYIHEKSNQTLIRPQDCADLRSHILQSTQKRTKLKQMLQQFRQMIENYTAEVPDVSTVDDPPNLLAKVKKEEPVHPPKISKSSPLAQFSIDYEEIDDDGDNNPTTTTVDEQSKSAPSSVNRDYDKHDNLNDSSADNHGARRNSKRDNRNSRSKDLSDQSMVSDMDSDEEEEDETDNDHPASDPDFGETRRTVRHSVGRRRRDSSLTRPAVNHFRVETCPLSNKYYGIDLNKHPLRHVPCTRHNIASISLFTHLRVFHCLSSKASLRLVRHIICNGCETDCDLFSQATESLVNILPKSYRGRCPLTKLGVFGLTKFHDIRLCHESQTHENTGLLNHFVVYHCLSYPWANKLCNAMQNGDYDGSKQILFKPNEPIKAEKWLTNQGKSILAKRLSNNGKYRRKMNSVRRKN